MKTIEQYNDIELFDMLKSNTNIAEKAFTELYTRYSPRVYAYCRRFLGARLETQDVFQDTFMSFYQAAQSEKEMSNIAGFILRIARNKCLNLKKSDKKNISYEDYMLSGVDDRTDQDELLNLIKRSLDLLPDEYREAFILREYEGLSYKEISDLTETNIANVKIRIFRAKQKIRTALAPYLHDLYQNEHTT